MNRETITERTTQTETDRERESETKAEIYSPEAKLSSAEKWERENKVNNIATCVLCWNFTFQWSKNKISEFFLLENSQVNRLWYFALGRGGHFIVKGLGGLRFKSHDYCWWENTKIKGILLLYRRHDSKLIGLAI